MCRASRNTSSFLTSRAGVIPSASLCRKLFSEIRVVQPDYLVAGAVVIFVANLLMNLDLGRLPGFGQPLRMGRIIR